jgi:hypothetical protein
MTKIILGEIRIVECLWGAFSRHRASKRLAKKLSHAGETPAWLAERNNE